MMTNRIVTIAAFCVYLIFMLCIGMYFVGKNKTTTEYFLGGRKLGSWVTSMSAQASDMSDIGRIMPMLRFCKNAFGNVRIRGARLEKRRILCTESLLSQDSTEAADARSDGRLRN